MDITLDLNYEEQTAKIKVFGVGGGGNNAVESMIQSKLSGVDFIVANTDAQALAKSPAGTTIQLGKNLTKGLGAGAKPDVGRAAAEEAIEEIRKEIGQADMVFITAGMGGGTGTGAAPVVAKVAKEQGALTVGVVTKPFQFEGPRRMNAAERGIAELSEHIDSLIVIPNARLQSSGPKNAKLTEMLLMADEVLYSAVRGITDLITRPGVINADFADVKTIMQERGMALMGTGKASGEHRAREAAEMAITSPLLEEVSIQGAKGLLVNISATEDILMDEYEEANNYITQLVGEDADIITAISIDPDAGDELTVTVVATGLDMTSQLIPPMAQKKASADTIEFNKPSQQNAVSFAEQPARHSQRSHTSSEYPTLTGLNTSYPNFDVNPKDLESPTYVRSKHGEESDVPTYLRKSKFTPNTHNPGSNSFLFSEDEHELPTFIHQQAN